MQRVDTYTFQEQSDLPKIWARILIWLLPIAFVWLRLLGIDHTLYIPLILGALTSLLVYSSISIFRMRYAVFQPIAGYGYLVR